MEMLRDNWKCLSNSLIYDIISINTIDVTAYTNAFAKAKKSGQVVVQLCWSEPGMSEGTIDSMSGKYK